MAFARRRESYAVMRISLQTLPMDPPGMQPFGDEGDGDRCDAYESPFPFRVLHDLADHQRSEDSGCSYPVADLAGW